MSTPSISFFDLDNTLYKGYQRYLILDFPVFLGTQNLFDTKELENLENLKSLYRHKLLERNKFALGVIDAYYHGLRGQSDNTIEFAAKQFLQINREQLWFTYTHPLLDLMRSHTNIIIISGSPFEILKLIQRELGVSALYATKGIVKDSIYTGEYKQEDEMATDYAKQRLVKQLITELGFMPETSFAFGDSESDFPLFSAVNPKNSFLISSDEEVSKQATARGWNITMHDDSLLARVKKRVNKVFSA